MFNKTKSINSNEELHAQLDALNKSQAVIEFEMNGTIKTANENFLNALGYELSEIKGKHHSMFVEQEYANSREYKDFWQTLNNGEFQAAEYMRLGKGGKEVWIQASYNPIRNSKDNLIGVIKFATEITEQKLKNFDNEGQIAAINKAQAVIHFNMDGTIIDANENFLTVLGYNLSEIQGKHHNMFVEIVYGASVEYKEFWEKLNRGEFQTAEYKRIGKGGKEVWIQASYNPIFDDKGRAFKVVKFATDVTKQKLQMADYTGQIEAINKAQAVIHFNLDGTIIDANENFLTTLGYNFSEIQGRHHSLFVEEKYGNSDEYKEFWKKLNRGEYQAAEYMRIGKNGKEIWIQASYNPILDLNGKPFKVVKFATDITVSKQERERKNLVQHDIAQELKNISSAMTNATEQASNAASASEETTTNVQSVAAGVEEFDASISSIAQSMQKSRETSDNAYQHSTQGGKATKRLLETASSMTSIVELIQGIASQINLLALNATIESARAGEAGKGFAVVASEVKNLADQAADATNQISTEIQGIQSVSNEVNDSFKAIQSSLEEVRTYVSDSAAAIEQQTSASREMTGNMQNAASGVSQINVNINEIARATELANTAAHKVEEMSKSIA
ncbi:MAG: PAS domain-containing methyl-accepting chemotaxis protein [Emcibacteraceae bacterium]|nr:PAS domain-containing methyl-accepting chemotaxis protein [Emcibacteraceae bacterium]